VPIYNSGSNALFCKTERGDLASYKGLQIAAGGTGQAKEVKSLGAASASVAYTELFESLQRGVVQCTTASLTVAVLGGFIPAAPHAIIDPEAGLALAPGGMAFSKSKWEELPLVARQLFWDRLDIFLSVNISGKIWPNTVEAAKQVKAKGGSIKTFAPDARKAVQDVNAGMLQDLRGTKALDGNQLVDNAQKAAEKWLKTVQDLGYKDEVGYNEFDTWYTDGKVDLTKYTDKLYADVFGAHRPK
jgi:TRAP-type C4-dicarboxylate transport system substrate-binding protein